MIPYVLLIHAGTLSFKNIPSSMLNSWYRHLGVVPSCCFLALDDAGTPNLLAKSKSDLLMAPTRGTVMLLWYRHLGVVPSSCFLAPGGTWTPKLLTEFEYDLPMAPTRGTVMLVLQLKFAFSLIFA